jgi:TonB family protein
MRTPSPTVHLSYCTNIHPGESWAEVRANLERYLVPVRERVAPGRPFGVGLRLSAESVRALAAPDALQELQSFLRAHDLYVFTINGFPYGPFHGRPVKEQVYRPDWLEDERVAYTRRLADILAAVLPDGMTGSISTGPGCFKPRASLDVVPRIVRPVKPVYPAMAMRQKVAATIVLTVLVSETGDVLDVRVLRGEPRFGLNDAAIRAMKATRFSAPMKDGKRVRTWFPQSIEFKTN